MSPLLCNLIKNHPDVSTLFYCIAPYSPRETNISICTEEFVLSKPT